MSIPHPTTPIKALLHWAWNASKDDGRRILTSCLMGLLRIGAGLTSILVSRSIIDAATSGTSENNGLISRLAILLATLLLSEMCCSLIANYLTNQTEIRMKNRLTQRLYRQLMQSRLESMEGVSSGDLLSRLTEDVRVLTEAVCRSLPDVIIMGVQLIAAFWLLADMSPALAIGIIGIMPLCLILSKAYMMKMRRLTAAIRADESRILTSMQEGLQHRVVIQTLEAMRVIVERLDTLQTSLYGGIIHRVNFNTFSRAMIRLGFIGGYLVTFLWCIWHLKSGVITFGMMTAFLQLVARIQSPMAGLTHYLPSFVHASASIDRLMAIETIPQEETGKPVRIKGVAGVRVKNLTFSYKNGDKNILQHFSHDFRPGSITAVMGETGVGKSTLLRLLLALLQPDEGEITVYDGEQSATVSAATRCNFVYVPQGRTLLSGTIRSNLLLANPEATNEELTEVLHTAVADFVFSLPQGLDSPCGEDGSELSEGQAQRIAIARALLRPGSILLLDEPNASLDTETANRLLTHLTKPTIAGQHTLIIISHRQEVIPFCNEVVYLS